MQQELKPSSKKMQYTENYKCYYSGHNPSFSMSAEAAFMAILHLNQGNEKDGVFEKDISHYLELVVWLWKHW